MGLDIPGATGSRPDAVPLDESGAEDLLRGICFKTGPLEPSGWNSNGSSTTGNDLTFRSAGNGWTAPSRQSVRCR